MEFYFPQRALIRAFLVCLVSCFGLAASAQASTVATVPVTNAQPVTTQSIPGSGTDACSQTWATVANVPSGYATGNCANGTHIHITTISDVTPNGERYFGGEVFGGYSGCGWIQIGWTNQVNTNSYTTCNGTSYALSAFSAQTNCAPGACTDGSNLVNPRQCDEYANFRPWASGQTPTNLIRSVGPNYNRLFWRYIARYPDTGGNQWVMVRDAGVAIGQGNWVFVRRSCLNL